MSFRLVGSRDHVASYVALAQTLMHTESLRPWQHEHVFGQDAPRAGERRTLLVTAMAAAMAVVEVAAGVLSGSMALLADGLHMASHTVALGISALAYLYTRRHAADPRFAFGTGKVNSLAGFTGAVLLAMFALVMAWESLERVVHPVAIAFDEAIAVAVLGLLVNGGSVLALDVREQRQDRHPHHDHNLWSAYLHVVADALTSLLAISALLAGKLFGLFWVDPLMGMVGALLVTRWSWSLLVETSAVLLDRQAPEPVRAAIREALEAGSDDRVSDLHVWSVAPGRYAAVVGLVTHEPRTADAYKKALPGNLGLVHASVEVHHCVTEAASIPARGAAK